jgi:hypothetical protein
MVAIGAVHALLALHLGVTRLYQGLHALELRTVRIGRLAGGEALLRLLQGLLRLSQTTADDQRIALDQVMEEVIR